MTDDGRMPTARPTHAVSVVMPAFNEAEILETTVGDVVDSLRRRGGSFELIVCENGSTDDTLAIARRLAEQVRRGRRPAPPDADYGAALHAGLRAARGDVVVNFDVDHYDMGFLDLAVAQINGARRAGDRRRVEAQRGRARRPSRRCASSRPRRSRSSCARCSACDVSDTHGMKAMDRAAVAPIARRCRFGKDLFDTELILRAERAGLRTGEIPVAVVERRPARTSILRRVPRTLSGLVKLRVALWRDRA